MIEWELIQGKDSLAQYRDSWNQIFNSGDYELSTSFEWTRALVSSSIKGEDKLFLLVLKERDKIVGIVPLVLRVTKKFGQNLLNLVPISEYANTHSDILIEKSSNEIMSELITILFKLGIQWDVFRMQRLLESNPFVSFVESNTKKNNIKIQIQRTEPSFILTLCNSYDDYLNKRSAKFRNYLRRMEKKLKMIGTVKYLSAGDFASTKEAYYNLLSVEERSWKHKHGTSINAIEERRKFFEELCTGTSEAGNLHLHFLYLDNKPIAYNLGLIKKNTYSYLRTSFDDEFRSYSPATILRAQLIKELIERALSYLDFPAEPYEWERHWTDELRWHKSILIYNNTIKAKFLRGYETLKHMSRKKHSSNNQFEYCNPRDNKP